MIICYFASVLITPIDQSLYESTRPQGGRLGMPFWQFNQTALDDPITHADLTYWRQMNMLRGFCGFVAWTLSFMIKEYDRAVDPLNTEYKIVPV